MQIFLETYGCTLNKADSQVIMNTLKNYKFTSLAKSDLVIINTCAVKNATESRMISTIKKHLHNGKHIVVAGCLPKIDPKILNRFNVSIVDCNSYNKLPEALEEIEKGNRAVFLSDDHKNKLNILCSQEGTPIVPIAEGCISNCSYCGTKHARGMLTSCLPEEIICLIKNLVKNNKKILLTAQDTGCYGFDIGTNLAELLERIVALDGNFTVRVGMMNPQHLKKQLPRLVKVFKNPKIIPFLHVPVQTGSDKVLKDMKRGYKVADFLEITKAFRKEVPAIYFSTDIIVGFPTETNKDFDKTLELIKKVKPENVNISQFYPRPRTAAKKMKQLPTEIKKQRSRQLAELCGRIKS
jgi:MiaB-like tRNA modifying enzyme